MVLALVLALAVETVVGRLDEAAGRSLLVDAAPESSLPPQTTIPVVLLGLNYRFKMEEAAMSLLCRHNSEVVLLTDTPQDSVSQPCARVELLNASFRAKAVEQMPWRAEWPTNQRVFFERWYVLRDWMRSARLTRAFTMDSDTLLFANVTEVAHELRWDSDDQTSELIYMHYVPPRLASNAGQLVSLAFLDDVTSFWSNVMGAASLYQVPPWAASTNPNDMTLFGHYFHYAHYAATGSIECWPLKQTDPMRNCEKTDYAMKSNLDRFKAAGLRARFAAASLSLNPDGQAAAGCVFDNNLFSDPIDAYQMSSAEPSAKSVSFVAGTPHFRARNGKRVVACSYILEDELEACVTHHVERALAMATCACSSPCCETCS